MPDSGFMSCPKCGSTNGGNRVWCWKCATQVRPLPPTAKQPSSRAKASIGPKIAVGILLGAVILIVIMAVANTSSRNLEEARRAKLRSTKSRMPWLIELPTTAKPLRLGWRFKACTIDAITLSDEGVSLCATNHLSWPTRPDVYVTFYDINGVALETIHPIRHVINDSEPGSTRTYQEPVPDHSSETEFLAVYEGSNANATAPSQPTSPMSTDNDTANGYIGASGNIWIGVRLYCKAGSSYSYVGKVSSIDNRHRDPVSGEVFDGVEVEYPSGNCEWKERSAVRAWGYIKKR